MKTKALSILLGLILILQGLSPYTVLAAYSPTVDSYEVYESGNTLVRRIDLGDRCRLELTMSDSGVKTSEIDKKDYITVQSVSGCFGSAKLSDCDILSSANETLSYKLTFDNVTYTGGGKNFAFKVNYKNLSYTSSIVNVKINECSEVSGSSTDSSDSDSTATTVTAPEVEVQRENMSPVKAGDEFGVKLTIRNYGTTDLLKPAVSVSTVGDISLAENSSTVYIPDIKAGTKTFLTLKFKAEDKLVKSTEEFTVNVKYNYNSGTDGIISNTETAVISVPTVITKSESAPVIQLTRGDVKAVKADTDFVVPVSVKNVGETAATNAVLSVTADDELKITDNDINYVLGELKPNETKTINVNLRSDELITSNYQSLACSLKYNYKSSDDVLSGEESAKLSVPVVSNTKEGATPLVQLTRSNIDTPIAAKRNFGFNITVKNAGMVDIQNSVLTLEGTDEVVPIDNSVSVGDLKSGESKTVSVKCRTMEELTSASQAISAELKYDYLSGKSYQQGSNEVKVIVPVVKTKENKEEMKGAVPNLIIDSFNYGNQSIANGENFNLQLTFKNTSKTTNVSNVVVTIEPGEALAISSAANTYYYDSLNALNTKSQTIEMQALPSAESGSAKVDVTFKYEYIDGKQRSEATTTQTVSVPIYKPDRMELTPKSADAHATVGEEYTIAIDYLNKGKGEVRNVRAELIGDIETTQSVQNLGNFESGKSGTINFIVIPSEVGVTPVTVKLTYEDANMQEKERVFNFNINADEAAEPEDFDLSALDAESEEDSSSGMLWWIIGGCGAAAVVIATVVIIKKKRKKAKAASVKVDWED